MDFARHRCHANGCGGDAPSVVPFCEKHWKMLPDPLKKKLWDNRWGAQRCPICHAGDGVMGRLKNEPGLWRGMGQWFSLTNIGIAIIMLVEYDEHDCPDFLVDDGGFCWGCGVHSSSDVYQKAMRVVEKYRMKGG